jgi:hypothetical protein
MIVSKEKNNNIFYEGCIDIKIACLNWTGTALLMLYNSNEIDKISCLEGILKNVIKDLMWDVNEDHLK